MEQSASWGSYYQGDDDDEDDDFSWDAAMWVPEISPRRLLPI